MYKKLILLIMIITVSIFFSGCTTNSLFKERNYAEVGESNSLDDATNFSYSETPNYEDVTENEAYVIVGDFVAQTLSNISPMYQELRDTSAISDYDAMAKAALKLQRYAENITEEYFNDGNNPYEEKFGELSTTELLIMKKFEGYLYKLKDYSTSLQPPLSKIKDDPSKFSEEDKIVAFTESTQNKKDAEKTLNSVFDTCNDFEIDCTHGKIKEKDLLR